MRMNHESKQLPVCVSKTGQDDSLRFRRLLYFIQAAYHAELCVAQSEMDELRHPRQFLTLHQYHSIIRAVSTG